LLKVHLQSFERRTMVSEREEREREREREIGDVKGVHQKEVRWHDPDFDQLIPWLFQLCAR